MNKTHRKLFYSEIIRLCGREDCHVRKHHKANGETILIFPDGCKKGSKCRNQIVQAAAARTEELIAAANPIKVSHLNYHIWTTF